jgi:phosphoenolpyruvate carboxylase
VRAACEHLKARVIGPATPIDIERVSTIIERYSDVYRRCVVELAPVINRMAKYVPARRARKLHIGLFGYARELGGVTLPRAISFTCSLYSLGLPPELIAFDALSPNDLAFVHEAYPSFEAKIGEALRFTDFDGPLMTDSLRASLEHAGYNFETHGEHLELVRRMRTELDRGDTAQLTDLVSRAAVLRRFLG